MLDASAAEMLDYLDRPIPALVRQDAAAFGSMRGAAYHGEEARKRLEEIERAIGAWINSAEEFARMVVASSLAEPPSKDDIEKMHAFVVRIEGAIERDAREFRRSKKWLRRLLKKARAADPAVYENATNQGRRYLLALARMGAVKLDLAFVLRSIIAEARPDNGTGPVFEDAKALGAYLRAAIAR